MFTDKDKQLFKEKGIPLSRIEEQLERFETGFPYMDLVSPATAGNGIKKLSQAEEEHYIGTYEALIKPCWVAKFVPASGAATRMFKDLLAFLSEEGEDVRVDDDDAEGMTAKHPAVGQFIGSLDSFPFYRDMIRMADQKGADLGDWIKKGYWGKIVSLLVDSSGMNYGQLPKGLLKFHSYPGHNRTAFEEHLVEGLNYARNDAGEVSLNFTVSEQHLELFRELADELCAAYEKEHKVKFRISFSLQDPSTDTIAVDLDNEPFRDKDGTIHFRPGGHGALLKNLNDLMAEVIFIKNIDNVAPDRMKEDTFLYKKVLGGVLLSVQQKLFSYLEQLTSAPSFIDREELASFIRSELQYDSADVLKANTGTEDLIGFLNRPLRVCGMVKNEGEPGGGPFWVREASGVLSLQIVETSQINLDEPAQAEILRKATHFNPVDLVCAPYDFRGEKFDLNEYTDPQTGFISKKSRDGRNLKALELPGLWNGAMARWITLFVEVPVTTFNPVKTINDLLRPEHQA